MTYNEKYKAVENTLKYLVEEGIAVKLKDGNYRLKTDLELEEELNNLLNE
jgi:hypothetical protein